MNRRRILTIVGGFSATLLLAIAFKFVLPASVTAPTPTILIGAAASLKDALEKIDPLFKAARPGIAVNYNFAASGPLQQQIEQGAPMDVFISAANQQMDALQEKGLILTDTRRNLLSNQLVLVVPTNSTLGIASFEQLTHVTRIAMGEPRSVPVGQYAEEYFKNIGILDQIQSKFILGNSVRNVLAAVESGNADAGVVYLTDAKISDQVKQVAIAPDEQHSPIVYPIAIVSSSQNPQAARAYARYLRRRQARQVFREYGFGIVRNR
jgi:molybdate transport system substrate-binding protein